MTELTDTLFETIKLGHVELRNRLFVPDNGLGLSENNLPVDRYFKYQRAPAGDGVALMTT